MPDTAAAADLDALSTTEALRLVGHGHRAPEPGRGAPPGKRVIYRLADGAEVGVMDVWEANAFVAAALAEGR